jgi:hypothetical protein
MIVRLAFYMTLVAVFYIYCSADSSSGNFKPPNDINLIETPSNDTTFLLDDAGTAFHTYYDSLHLMSSNYLQKTFTLRGLNNASLPLE